MFADYAQLDTPLLWHKFVTFGAKTSLVSSNFMGGNDPIPSFAVNQNYCAKVLVLLVRPKRVKSVTARNNYIQSFLQITLVELTGLKHRRSPLSPGGGGARQILNLNPKRKGAKIAVTSLQTASSRISRK